MKIRDIQAYLKGRCPNCSLEKLGTDDEPFLETIYGQDQEIDSTIRDVASFASNAEEQLFYEFVQNAFDAHADTLCFHFDEKYLIVLNNGEPFYTDPREKNPRDGQLYNFLAKGKSLKAGDKSKSGEFGQGSKLLYTLISDKGVATSNKKQLITSIKEQKKGPYIVSWKNSEQLDNFRFLPAKWEYSDPHSGNNDLLVAKILMSYYPIAPGVDQSLFSDSEFEDIRDAFERLVDPKRNVNRLNRGTAIIVPLGKGQYEAISSKENLENVYARLGGFASITSDKEKNHGRHLDHIFVDGSEVELHKVHSIFTDFQIDGEDFSYQFAFNPVFAREGSVNIFKTLPVLQSKFRFGFIIDSQNFELDSSRQRINDEDKTCSQLTYAFNNLLEKIKQMKENDREGFELVYTSLIKSSPLKENADNRYIREPFYKTFTPFFKDNVKTQNGDYLPIEQVRRPVEGHVSFPLEELGIEGFSWISDAFLKNELQRYDLKVAEFSLEDAVKVADETMMKSWIASLPEEVYSELQKECIEIVNNDESLKVIPLFRTNKGRVISFNDVVSSSEPVFLYSEQEGHSHMDRCKGIEYLLSPLDYESKDGTENNGTINIKKIASNIDSFRGNDSMVDAASQIIVVNSHFKRVETAIREKVALLKDFNGNYLPFCELFRNTPEDSVLYDHFMATGYIPTVLPDEFFISGPDETWSWTENHVDEICALPDWAEYHDVYLKDLVAAYESAAGAKHSININLDENGVPLTGEKTFILNGGDKLTSEEYDLVSMFSENNGYRLVPRRFVDILKEPPFGNETAEMKDIISDGCMADAHLLRSIIKCFPRILSSCRIASNDGYSFSITKKERGWNYLTRIESLEAEEVLAKRNFFRIDGYVSRFFEEESLKRFVITSDPSLMKNAIDSLDGDDLFKIIPWVKVHGEEVINYYYDKISTIEVDEKLEESSPVWQVIKLALVKEIDRDRMLSLIKHHGQHLPDTIKGNTLLYDGHNYDLYELINQIKDGNLLVESFLSCLPDKDFFRSAFYGGHEEVDSAEDIYDSIPSDMTVPQLEFYLHYSETNDVGSDEYRLKNPEDLREALDMIRERRFQGFDKRFCIDNLDTGIQVLADHSLLIQEERLPDMLEKWLLEDQTNKSLMSELLTEDSPHIAFRKSLSDGLRTSIPGDFMEDKKYVERTAQWIVEQSFHILMDDVRYNSIQSFIINQPENTDSLLMMHIVGTLSQSESGDEVPVFSPDFLDSSGALIENSNLRANASIFKRPEIRLYFEDHNIFEYYDHLFLERHEILQMDRLRITSRANNSGTHEYVNDLYLRWRKMPESDGIKILLSAKPVETVMSVTEENSGNEVIGIRTQDNRFGYNTIERTVIIQHPNKDSLSEMKTLEQASRCIDFFKNPFIALQGLYVDMIEQGLDPQTVLGETDRKASELVKDLGVDNFEKIAANKDTIAGLVENLSDEELKLVLANKDRLSVLMEDAQDDMQSQVRKTIGYIGEQIYKLYLDKNSIKYEYSAEEGIGDYDFRIINGDNGPDTYVDVKTNLYSFKEDTVPFYIHKSQNRFMQDNPDAEFRIIRISLTDINVKKEYERIRDLYGPDADYETNPDLKNRCEKLAKRYWRGARIEEFDSLSPEYGIRIEKHSKQ